VSRPLLSNPMPLISAGYPWHYWAAKWQADGSAETMHGQLRERVRLLAGRGRTVRDYERLPAHHETYIYWSMIVMTRRLARTPGPARTHAQPQAT
jgi:transposase